MTILRATVLCGLTLFLAACGQGERAGVTADGSGAGDGAALPSPPMRSQTPTLPGRGPTSFVGRWAADVSWCVNPQGDGRPIEITPTRFEGYENSCEIAALQEVADGYVATLACVAEGRTSSERVHFQVSNTVLRLTWLDRQGDPVEFNKCTTLGDTATRSPVAP